METPGFDSISEQAETGWTAVLAARPELAEAVSLHRQLVGGVIECMRALEREGQPVWTLAPGRLGPKLRQGVPALRGETIPLPMGILGPRLLQFCGQLGDGGAGTAARHVLEALESRRVDAGSLLAASLARDETRIRNGAHQLGLAPDLVWLLGELAVSPVASRLARSRFGSPDPDGAADWEAWARGYCPACGSWPALIEVCAGRRQARCAFCGTAWEPDYGCTYCGEAGEPFATAAPDSDQPHRRLELCAACGGYLKTLDRTEAAPFPLTSIDDLASADLDLVAMERGYRRLPLAEIASFVESGSV